MKNEPQKLDKRNVEDIKPLTPLQEGILYHYLAEPQSHVYFEQLSLQLSGSLDIPIFQKAWAHVIDTNEMLRTVFRWEQIDNPVQIILRSKELSLKIIDLSTVDANEQEQRVEEIRIGDRSNGIDIRHEPFVITLCLLQPSRAEMIINSHHILYDGWSNGIILKDFFGTYQELYDGKSPVRQAKRKFGDYITWLRKQDKQQQNQYWGTYLQAYEPQAFTSVFQKESGTREAGDSSGKETATLRVKCPPNVLGDITSFIANHEVTLAALIYAVWGIGLQKYNRTNDVLFGTTVSGRTSDITDIQDVVGLFINTVPLRIASDSGDRVFELVQRTNKAMRAREPFENTSLVDIQSQLGLGAGQALFDSLVVIENYPLDQQTIHHCTALKTDGYRMFEMTNYDLTLNVLNFDGLAFEFSYCTDTFDESKIKRLSAHFMQLLSRAAGQPNIAVKDLSMLDEAETEQLLVQFNRTERPYDRNASIQEQFERQARLHPDRPAVLFRERQLTYRELNEQANQVARFLREKGVKENSIVGLMMERSVELVTGMMGILKAGAAYLPIDLDNPPERIAYLLQHSQAGLLLTNRELQQEDSFRHTEAFSVEHILRQGYSTEDLQLNYDQERLIYLLYTSGSTGQPKGVMVRHDAFLNLLNWYTREMDINENERMLFIAPTSFDLAQKNIFAPLVKGGRLYIYEPGIYDYNVMSDMIRQNQLTTMNCAPSAFYPLLDFNHASSYERLSSLTRVVLGGEPIQLAKVRNWLSSPTCHSHIINSYGPTECTDIATFHRVDSNNIQHLDHIPIGQPIDNVSIYILDEHKQPVPAGVPGELCIGGTSLAKGYFHDDVLTGQKFVAADHLPTRSVYKTNDLARWTEGGVIEYLGRLDYQVKIRGFRVELGEIESRILTFESVREVAVIDQKDAMGHVALCAYVVNDEPLSDEKLQRHVSQALPSYMNPRHYVYLDRLPLTPNGKVDRKALPVPQEMLNQTSRQTAVLPTNETERKLADIWVKILGIEQVGIHDNFFDLGGNSLLLIQMHGQIERQYPGKLKITDFFTYPTIAALARLLDPAEETGSKLELEGVVFPADFFVQQFSPSPPALLDFEIEGKLLDQLAGIARHEGVDLYDIIASIYLYVLSDNIDQKKMVMYTATSADALFPLQIDLEQLSHVAALFHEVYRQRTSAQHDDSYRWQDLSPLAGNRNNNHMLLCVYDRSRLAEIDPARYFHIALGLDMEEERIQFHFECAARSYLQRDKMKSFIQEYAQLLHVVAEKYEAVNVM